MHVHGPEGAAAPRANPALPAEMKAIVSVRFSPDGKRVLTYQTRWDPVKGPQNEVKLWDAKTGAVVLTHVGASGVTGFSVDGRRLASVHIPPAPPRMAPKEANLPAPRPKEEPISLQIPAPKSAGPAPPGRFLLRVDGDHGSVAHSQVLAQSRELLQRGLRVQTKDGVRSGRDEQRWRFVQQLADALGQGEAFLVVERSRVGAGE